MNKFHAFVNWYWDNAVIFRIVAVLVSAALFCMGGWFTILTMDMTGFGIAIGFIVGILITQMLIMIASLVSVVGRMFGKFLADTSDL